MQHCSQPQSLKTRDISDSGGIVYNSTALLTEGDSRGVVSRMSCDHGAKNSGAAVWLKG